MTSLLDYVEDKIRESDNPFQSDYRSEVDTLISLAFPSTQKRRKKWEHPDYNSMSDEEYYASPHFQGQGRVAESHPVASVVGPLKGANVLRKWALGQAAKPKPTTAPLAITDQTQAPLAEPLRLEGPPDLPMLTYDDGDEPSPYMDYDELRSQALWEATTGGDPTAFLEMQAAEDEVPDPDAAYPVEVNQEYNPDYDGGFPEQGDFNDNADDEEVAMHLALNGILGKDNSPPLSDEEFYTKPEGYTSSLDKIIAGDTLTKAEKDSAIREIKYSNLSYDDKHFDLNDPYKGLDFETEVDESGNILPSSIPSLTDPEAIKKFKEKRPLEFTVRHSDDTVGGMPGDKATHLYFGGTNLERQSEERREHFFTNGRPAQAFITWNERNGSFNMGEIQSEMSGTNPYGNQVITKLAQQTWIDFKDSGLSTITIPKGEPIFDKYYSTQGKGLWADESKLLKLKDNNEFDKKTQEFYNQPILQEEINKDVRSHISLLKHLMNLGESIEEPLDGMRDSYGVEYGDMILEIVNKTDMTSPSYTEKNSNHQDAVDIFTLHRIKKLKDLKGNYEGKVRHYNKYFKAWQKAGKQHGAELDIKETPEGWEVDLTNPEETFRKVETDGFTMAMLLKKTKKSQVA